jgi:CSLREA domain-containing protein
MTNTQTTRTNHYFRAALALLAMVAAMLLASGVALAATSTSAGPGFEIRDNTIASGYPSNISFTNLSGKIADVNLTLDGFRHTFPDDVDVLLVGPQGQKALLMSDVGGSDDVNSANLTLDDEAGNSIPDGAPITATTYKPTQGTSASGGGQSVPSSFPAPAPPGPYATSLSAFDGTDPNGTWKLFVIDDSPGDFGAIEDDWKLQVSTESTTPQTFTVDSTADTGDSTPDGACDSPCTLREAIQEANANFNPTAVDRIKFAISGTGVHTISPASPLPTITEPVNINGYSQRNSSVNTLAKGTNARLNVELDGSNAGESDGLTVQTRNSVIRGLVINRFNGKGIFVQTDSSATRIEGNFVGTDSSGTVDRGNESIGVSLFFHSRNSTVGGATPAARNLISGNRSDGVEIFVSHGNRVLGNLIGTKKDGIGALGNDGDGIRVSTSSDNLVGEGSPGGANTVAFNGEKGVQINSDGTGIRVSRNSVFSNVGLGIDLLGPGESGSTNVPTKNDAGDTDSGPNNLQNKPVLTSAKNAAGKSTIKGKLDSASGKTFTIEFFSNPPGADEGKQFIGETTIKTTVDGLASFTFSPASKVALGQAITATATRNATGDTSEFSAPKTVVAS